MKEYLLILFIIVTFSSNAAVAVASETGLGYRSEAIAYVIAFVCVSMAAAFLISLRGK
jgi:hypothetical protein